MAIAGLRVLAHRCCSPVTVDSLISALTANLDDFRGKDCWHRSVWPRRTDATGVRRDNIGCPDSEPVYLVPAGSVSVEAWSCDAERNKGGLSAGHGS